MPESTTPPAKPMKEDELRQRSTCAHCQRKIGQTHNPIFFKITIEQHILNLPAIERQQGLGMQLSGNGFLARHMGPDEDMTITFDPPQTITLCQGCTLKPLVFAGHLRP